jgi:hypothetical protein
VAQLPPRSPPDSEKLQNFKQALKARGVNVSVEDLQAEEDFPLKKKKKMEKGKEREESGFLVAR